MRFYQGNTAVKPQEKKRDIEREMKRIFYR